MMESLGLLGYDLSALDPVSFVSTVESHFWHSSATAIAVATAVSTLSGALLLLQLL
jgi:hypothetical protein